MTSPAPAIDPPADLAAVPAAVQARLRTFLDERRDRLAEVGGDVPALAGMVVDFTLAGGKRVRPAFAWSGYRCCGGTLDGDVAHRALTVCSALELIQACALIHDDIIDRSAIRRGRPTVHRAAAALHEDRAWSGDAAHFGTSAAILAGDLALCWADDLLAQARLPEPIRDEVARVWDAMRTEVVVGQLLDIAGEAAGDESVHAAFRVMRYKTAAYTVARPLQLGACLAAADAGVIEALGAVGDGLGLAFQLRDDLLGVVGDPARTGKPSGDDLEAGKRTVLLASALSAADRQDPRVGAELRSLIGRPLSPDDLTRARAILVETGAVADVEARIDRLIADSIDLLRDADLAPGPRDDLIATATLLARRVA